MKHNVALSVVCFVLTAILIFAGVCVVIAYSENDNYTDDAKLSQWMGMIKDETLLKKIAIPGAHDAGTAGLSYLAETQSLNTEALLCAGVRYLDLRVAKTDNDLKIYHGPFKGVTLDGVLESIKQFLVQHPTEMVIVDFQHFDGDAQQPTLDLFLHYFDESLTVKNKTNKSDVEFVDGLTLGECRGKALVVWGRDTSVLEQDFLFQRNNDDGTRENSVIHSYYQTKLNTKSSKNYISEALPYYLECYKTQNCGLFVWQGQLTDGLFVFGPRFREATHNKNMTNFIDSLKNSADLEFVNIIIRDYISPAKCCNILQLNSAKGVVKTELATEYLQMTVPEAGK